ncbi:MAG TPA: pentapeptide repeat-containing protein [Hyphomicrobiaceae bacterium]|nr:pentapeptide repeat-containing protein [Hyphomicrobiaceae bacterium]
MAAAWTTEEITAIQAAIFLKRGAGRKAIPMPASPRGTLPTGLADFRGFPLTEVACVSISDADFTRARAPKNQFGVEQSIQLQDVIGDRSVFDRAGKFLRLMGQFTTCSFRKITTKSCSVNGTFTDCDFSGANFKLAHFNARFIRCRFHDCNLHLASWPSTFEDCEFKGAGIHDIFGDVRAAAFASDRVTFTVTTSKVIVGGRT